MDKLKLWLNCAERKQQVPVRDLVLLINRLETSEVSIKAFNAISINYSSLLHVSTYI